MLQHLSQQKTCRLKLFYVFLPAVPPGRGYGLSKGEQGPSTLRRVSPGAEREVDLLHSLDGICRQRVGLGLRSNCKINEFKQKRQRSQCLPLKNLSGDEVLLRTFIVLRETRRRLN